MNKTTVLEVLEAAPDWGAWWIAEAVAAVGGLDFGQAHAMMLFAALRGELDYRKSISGKPEDDLFRLPYKQVEES